MQDIYLGFYLIYSFHLQVSIVLPAAFSSFTQTFSHFQFTLFFPLRLQGARMSGGWRGWLREINILKIFTHPARCSSLAWMEEEWSYNTCWVPSHYLQESNNSWARHDKSYTDCPFPPALLQAHFLCWPLPTSEGVRHFHASPLLPQMST